MSAGRAGGCVLAAVALVVLTAGCGGEAVAPGQSSVATGPTGQDQPSRPLDERDDARDAVRVTDLTVAARSAPGLEITVSNLGPNPAIEVVVVITIQRGSLDMADPSCAQEASGFRCSVGELPARSDIEIVLGGGPAQGTVSVSHDGPELQPGDNTVAFG